LLIGGVVFTAAVGLLYLRARSVHADRQLADGHYNAAPFLVWAALGVVALLLGAIFFAGGEVVRSLRRADGPAAADELEGAARNR
jgi:multisubunit Na+/H+ antiporter MnhB subunit